MKKKVLAHESVVGHRIVSPEGIFLGRIERLMLDVTEGRISFALVRFAGPLGLGDDLVPLPWEALASTRFRRRFVLEVDRELIKTAPRFNGGETDATRETAREVRDHYGLERLAV
jgi:sporulation protein YlmC with PRC-barrel domain